MRNYYGDGKLSGRVVNSIRQLWSVAGYAGMIMDRGHSLDKTACYSITAVYPSGNESFPSEPLCYWPISAIQHYPVNGHHMRSLGGAQVASANGRVFLHEWGQAYQKLQLEKVTPAKTGVFALQAEYANNDRNNTGITCGVKKVSVIDEKNGEVIKSSIIGLPHVEGGAWADSVFVPVALNHLKAYKYRGGKNGMYNMINFAEIKVLYLGD